MRETIKTSNAKLLPGQYIENLNGIIKLLKKIIIIKNLFKNLILNSFKKNRIRYVVKKVDIKFNIRAA